MVKKITVFAILASMAMAAPTTSLARRTLPGAGGSPGFGGIASGPISTSSGWNFNVAGALEACRSGVPSGSVDDGNRQALLSWLEGAGSGYLDFPTCQELKKWCSAGDEFIVGTLALIALDASFIKDEAVSAAGSVIGFLNEVMFEDFGHSTCLCSVLSGADQPTLLTWLESSAAAGIEAGISGALHSCAVGGIAASLSSAAQDALSSWLSSDKCPLSGEMKRWIQGWLTECPVGTLVDDAAEFIVVLTSESLSGLQGFMEGSSFGGLDVSIQAGIHACAAGGVAGSMDVFIYASMSSWISSPQCPLESGLKRAIGSWLQGSIGAGVQAVGSATFPYVSAGHEIAHNFNPTGCLTGPPQSSLSSFCSGPAGAALDGGILVSLKGCAAGGRAASMEPSAASALSEWLSHPSCPLDSEMRGMVIAWMGFGITDAAGAMGGVGVGAGAGYAFSPKDIGSIQSAMAGCPSMSPTVKGAFGFVIAGQSAGAVSIPGRAEMAAFLCGEAGSAFGGELHGALIGWMCGSGPE